MVKPLQQVYYPLPVPTEPPGLPRYLEEELERIKNALYAEPVSLSVSDTGTITIDPTPGYERLFDDGTQTPTWEVPGGSFDNTTGEWTNPQDGLYSVGLQLPVDAFGPGNKTYFASTRITQVRDSAIINQWEATDGGDDDVPLSVSQTGLVFLQAGDVLYTEAQAVHEQFTGTATYSVGWQILRTSA